MRGGGQCALRFGEAQGNEWGWAEGFTCTRMKRIITKGEEEEEEGACRLATRGRSRLSTGRTGSGSLRVGVGVGSEGDGEKLWRW